MEQTLISGDAGSDYIQGNAGNDTLNGGDGSDRINGGADNDLINGGEGNDTINGNLGKDVIDGGTGNDSLRGGQGDDSILGSGGNDVILGDLGNDTIVGGLGLDVLTGGEGRDLFVFRPVDATFSETGEFALFTDVITDFTHGQDHLNIGITVKDVFDGPEKAFDSLADALEYARDKFADADEPAVSVVEAQVGSDAYIFYDANGDLQLDSAIRLLNVQIGNLDTDDFTTLS